TPELGLTFFREGVYYLDPRQGRKGPPTWVLGGQMWYRFMDFIYVPCALEELNPIQVYRVNALRRRLIAAGQVGATNDRVRSIFSDVLRFLNRETCVEWGCGFNSLKESVQSSHFWCTDIDPAVISYQNDVGHTECWHTSDLLSHVPLGRIEIIPSLFVFH